MTKILSNKSNIDLDYPICRPSLDLDFTQEVLDPRITFSRGTVGTRVNRNRLIETVSANQPRFDYDPVTGECKGLLIEELRTNSLLRSEDFTDTYWGVASLGGTITANQTIAPDGTTTADLYQEDTSTGGRYFSKNISFTSGTNYTISIWAKKAPGSTRYLGLVFTASGFGVNANAAFTLSGAGSYNINIFGTSTSAGIQAYSNGWYRCYLTSQATVSGNSAPQFRITQSSTNGTGGGTGDGTSGIYLWGAQLEAGAFPTSYIPTVASTVTRSVDNAEMTGTNFSSWYNQSEGTVYTKANSNNLANGGTIFIASNASYTERYAQLGLTGNVGYGYGATWFTNNSIIGGGAFTLVGDTYANGAYKKIAVSGIAGNFNGVSGNQILSSKKTNLYPSGITQARIGSYNNNVSYLNGTISRLTYYPKALKPNHLQTLTS